MQEFFKNIDPDFPDIDKLERILRDVKISIGGDIDIAEYMGEYFWGYLDRDNIFNWYRIPFSVYQAIKEAYEKIERDKKYGI